MAGFRQVARALGERTALMHFLDKNGHLPHGHEPKMESVQPLIEQIEAMPANAQKRAWDMVGRFAKRAEKKLGL